MQQWKITREQLPNGYDVHVNGMRIGNYSGPIDHNNEVEKTARLVAQAPALKMEVEHYENVLERYLTKGIGLIAMVEDLELIYKHRSALALITKVAD